MKSKIIRLIILGVVSMLIVGCGSRIENIVSTPITDKLKTDNNSVDLKEITQKIVFVKQYTNWSDTYQNRGYYIDYLGNKVGYDVSTLTEQYADISNLVSYLEYQEDVKRETCLDENKLNQCFDWLQNIASNYTLTETSNGADQGSHCFYGIRYKEDGKMIPILLEESGDSTRINTDPYAVNIMEELHKIK